jgi:hypothetical protein
MASQTFAIGDRKQLFIDERFIARSQGIGLCMNPPIQHPDPVLVPDRPWEVNGIGAYNTAMLERDGRFRLWYDAGVKGGLPTEGARRLGYAESEDGLTWHKPDLGLITFQGSKENNLVAPLSERQSLQGATVIRDERAPQEERYKLWTKFLPTNEERAAGARPGLWGMYSPDGFRWNYYPDQPNPEGSCDTQNMLFWDDRFECYVGYTRVSATQHMAEAAAGEGRKKYRSVGRVTSTDFRTWSELEIVFEADEADLAMPVPYRADSITPNIDYYTSCAMKYEWAEDVYLMMPSAYYHWGEDQYPATMDVQLLTSRDGISWSRAGDREPFLRQGFDDSSTSGMIFANPWLLPVGDELWFYYNGTPRSHGPLPPGVDEESFARRTGIFRASMRRDGFVSADAGYAGGELTTPLLAFEGNRLELNCDGSAGGWLQVEILDAEDRPIPGYSLADSDDVRGNGLSKRVTWKGNGNVGPLAGQLVRLRFAMRGMKLFALQFCR